MRRKISPVVRFLMLSPLIFWFFLFTGSSYSQNTDTKLDSASLAKKLIEAIRITTPPKIDGNLDEDIWKSCPVAKEFVEFSPRNATEPYFDTEVRFAYDDIALYASAIMHDPHPDSIFNQLGKRDQIEQLMTDYLSFDILPYDDDLNMFEFKVSPGNLQNDCKYSPVGQDITWDAVWESATSINDSAWIIEIKIPFSALRFPKTENQVWGINMWRNNLRRREYSTWSWVDNKTQDVLRYYGKLIGMKNIKPPLRLSFSPYLSGYAEKNADKEEWSYFFRGGMDVKWGINESYTLDMMLIPDFGQVQSDDIILNLSPFEVRYDEKRQFFTEATEMFNKCGIFYTRRVGSQPKNYYMPYDSLKQNETVTDNPEETRIINATKVSGRNRKGFGIGVFNAMTTNTWAEIEDTVTGNSRKLMTQPFTNYNVLVFDQNLKNNSYITLINTNYYIPDDKYVANVTGAETKLCNKKNTFAAFGKVNVSQIFTDKNSPDLGYEYLVHISRPSGKFQYRLLRQEINKNYNPNDLGFLLYNNETNNQLRLTYYNPDPFWKVIITESHLITDYSTLNQSAKFKTLRFSLEHSTTFTSYWTNRLAADYQPLGYDDYYESRTWGKVFKIPWSYWIQWRLSSDTRKKFSCYNELSFGECPGLSYSEYNIGLSPRLRFSDRFSITLSINYLKALNNYGWVETDNTAGPEPVIYFGRRDISTFNNILSSQFIFSTKTSLSLRVRHYWSQAEYFEYYTLNNDGYLDPNSYWQNNNINFNAFTVDLQFIWYFAPGSELSVVWKNNINTQGNMIETNYFRNFEEMISSPQTNSFSFRVLYYLDYLYIKKLFTKKKD